MATARWSLANRLTAWVSAIAVLPGLATFVLGGLFLESSSSHEMDLLVAEEAEETVALLRATDRPVAAFPAICRELASHHPSTPLAWRLADGRTGATLAEGGHVAMLAERCPGPTALGATIDLGAGFYETTVGAPDGMLLLLAADGRSERLFVDRFWVVAGILMAASTLLAMLAGRFVARRVASLVREVADDVRSTPADGQLVPRRAAPDEIHAVVDALRTELQRIREGSEKLRLFTAGLAHELRSPLQNLIAQAEVALLRPRDPPAYAAVLASQLDELSELSDAIDNLLAICSSSSRAQPGPREEFDLLEETQLRLPRERSRADREGIDLQLHATGDARIAGDREGAMRGIRNVVANAIDWTPPGGRVRLSIDGEPERVVVTVDDSGPGVPADHRERIFEPFFQGPAQDRRRVGYGLGLAIARSAVAEHGGRIQVDASPLGGARFQLTFRRQPPAQS